MADSLHDRLGMENEEARRALVRIEEMSAKTKKKADLEEICRYVKGMSIPFAVLVIPYNVDNKLKNPYEGKWDDGLEFYWAAALSMQMVREPVSGPSNLCANRDKVRNFCFYNSACSLCAP